uniref:Dynamin-type G domain-containing protein n=1 Tax=Rhabditophanes sp. KR3021 TaxID=114890 RepID=A0AC35THS2_9BILA
MSLTNNNAGDKHLQKFIHAKSEMTQIYDELENHIKKASKFYDEINDINNLSIEPEVNSIQNLINSIDAIKDTFQRDKMKVVFFGSNGKSTVINAMLHKKILPQGMGHTTCCFLQLEASPTNDQFLMADNNKERIDFSKLHLIGHALSDQNNDLPAMGTSSLLKIFLPQSFAQMLQNDVVIVDSPGIDFSAEFDSWIDDHCLDADVFVLVSNSEATLTRAEKSFFQRVSKKLAKPNIFILNNRWDASDDMMKHQIEAVKQQHMTRFIEFLVQELEVCTEEEAKNRIFFTSAKEMLELRLNCDDDNAKFNSDNHEARAHAFKDFEETFKDCISKSAINTKFESYNVKARELINEVNLNISHVIRDIDSEREVISQSSEEMTKKLKTLLENFKLFNEAFHEQMFRVREEVHRRVSSDFYEIVHRLDAFLDDFHQPLHDDEGSLALYRAKICEHINSAIDHDLRNLCGVSIENRIRSVQMDIYDNVKDIYDKENAEKIDATWKRVKQPTINININCRQWMEDFEEDLDFHFTLGFTNIVRIAVSLIHPPTEDKHTKAIAAEKISDLKKHVTFAALTEQREHKVNEKAALANVVFSSIYSAANAGVGAVVVGGLLYRTLGPKVITVGAVAYGAFYAFERFNWNRNGKEKNFKNQLKQHISIKLKDSADYQMVSCENETAKELENSFDHFKHTANDIHYEMKSQIDQLHKKNDSFTKVIKDLGIVKCDAQSINSKINDFKDNYLFQ